MTLSWAAARAELDVPDGCGLNMAYQAVGRHAIGPSAQKVALLSVPTRGEADQITYRELDRRSNQFANALGGWGVEAGERVFVLAPRSIDMCVVSLGVLKRRAVLCPLFSSLGPVPLRQRIDLGSGRTLVTTSKLFRRKVAEMIDDLPGIEHVVLIDAADEGPRSPDRRVHHLGELMKSSSPRFEIPPTSAEDPALLHFTSGTTGPPKGAIHVHDAVVSQYITGRLALDLRADDVFWCTADPGWVTGIAYGLISPLTCGVTNIIDTGPFDAEWWLRIIEDNAVTVLYTSPTALRMLRRALRGGVARPLLTSLRLLASVGEPLEAELIQWSEEVLGLPVHDTWWQTETGGIMIANLPSMDIHRGSMGKPLPGVAATVLSLDQADQPVIDASGRAVEADEGVTGMLALRPGWPSMFRGYLGEPDLYEQCFQGGWYLSGDLARRDTDGYFWFAGRSDDIIKSAGHLISPFEVESVLRAHPAVAEVGVVGAPDPISGCVVKAFICLESGFEPSEDLGLDIIGFARRQLGPALAPRSLEFDQHLPHTESGKIIRRELRERS